MIGITAGYRPPLNMPPIPNVGDVAKWNAELQDEHGFPDYEWVVTKVGPLEHELDEQEPGLCDYYSVEVKGMSEVGDVSTWVIEGKLNRFVLTGINIEEPKQGLTSGRMCA